MPGAQPRRDVMHRAASSMARRAWVPQGVPGVHRVRRSFTPPGEAIVADWIQPPDQAVTLYDEPLHSAYNSSEDVFPPPEWPYWSDVFAGTTPAVLGTVPGMDGNTQIYGDAYSGIGCYCRKADWAAVDCPPTSPSPPPGQSVVYESAQGYVVTATVTCQVSATTASPITGDGYVVELSSTHTGWPSPAELQAGTLRAFSAAGGATDTYTATVTPGPGSRFVGVFAAVEGHHYNNTAPSALSDTFDVRDFRSPATVACTYTYRPPRYRFV